MCVCVRALHTHVTAHCSMKPTGPPIIIDPAPAFPPAPLLSSAFPFASREEGKDEDVLQIIVKPCFHALPPLPRAAAV